MLVFVGIVCMGYHGWRLGHDHPANNQSSWVRKSTPRPVLSDAHVDVNGTND